MTTLPISQSVVSDEVLPPLEAGLTITDRETLAHLLRSGMGENTLRATRSDLAYLETWSMACDGLPLCWPPSREIVLRFIAHHLWDPDQKQVAPEHGMPAHVRTSLEMGGYLRSKGPHAPSTVERRLSTWKTLCKWHNVEHPFGEPEITRVFRAAVRASGHSRGRKSRKAVDINLMYELLDHLDQRCGMIPDVDAEVDAIRLRALRDRALLAVMFASGGRRRSEVSNLMHGQILRMDPLTATRDWPDGIPCMGLRLHRTKTANDGNVYLSGRAVVALQQWCEVIEKGPVFRRIDRWGLIHEYGISSNSVNTVLKKRLKEIGREPADFSAHGIRAGYITSALKAGIPAPEIMQQTLHRSLNTLMGYFNDELQRQGRAAHLL